MKKFSWIFALILALSMAFVFAGCGEEPSNPGTYDGSGPKLIDALVDWMDTLPGGEVVLTNADLGVNFAKSGSPTLTKTEDGTVTVTDVVNGWDGFTLTTVLFNSLGVAPPFDLTFKGKMITPGRLKISQAGENYATVKEMSASAAADAEFEVTGTVTAAHLLSSNADTPGVRLQNQGSDAANFEITSVVITKK